MVKKAQEKPKKRIVCVEGGGDKNPSLASECRRAFSNLFTRAGITKKPRVIACGGRKAAYAEFCRWLGEEGVEVWLLVDAESAVASDPPFRPWEHIKSRLEDSWDRPPGAEDSHLHLMNICMETWLLADHEALVAVFGPKLETMKLPSEGSSLERVSKKNLDEKLQSATKPTPSERYDKGSHSFRALAKVDPEKLRALPWAKRFLEALNA